MIIRFTPEQVAELNRQSLADERNRAIRASARIESVVDDVKARRHQQDTWDDCDRPNYWYE